MSDACKTCKKPLEGTDAWLWGECSACRVDRDKRHTRYMGCFLMPLWMPFGLRAISSVSSPGCSGKVSHLALIA